MFLNQQPLHCGMYCSVAGELATLHSPVVLIHLSFCLSDPNVLFQSNGVSFQLPLYSLAAQLHFFILQYRRAAVRKGI